MEYAFSVSDVCYRLEHSRLESLGAYSAFTDTNVNKVALTNLVSVLQWGIVLLPHFKKVCCSVLWGAICKAAHALKKKKSFVTLGSNHV